MSAIVASLILSVSLQGYKVPTNADPSLFDADRAFFLRGDPNVKTVALSIDDGPHIQYAPKILEALRRTHTHATFFVVGVKVKEHPEILRQMLAQGHELGDHSMTHPRLDSVTHSVVVQELTLCREAIKAATGKTVWLMRPPGVRYTDDVLYTAKKLGFVTVAENIGASDYIVPGDRTWYRGNPGYEKHVSAVKKAVLKQLKNGAIIDLHDMPTTADALEEIIKDIRRRGYKIVTVSELLRQLPSHQE